MSITEQDQDHHVLLDPIQLKQMVNDLPKNQKHHHDQYEYVDTEDLKTELNEFFSYNEIRHLLTEQDDAINNWRSMKPKEQQQHIHHLLTTMKKKKRKTDGKLLLHQQHINAAKELICLLLFGPDVQPSQDGNDDDDRKLYQLSQTVLCITEYDGLALVCRRLKRIMNKISASNNVTKEISMEMDMYLTLAYLIIETRRQLKLDPLNPSDHHYLDSSFIECLFCFIGKIQDAHVEQLPVRKMMLLLWKSMLVTFGGGLDHIQTTRQQDTTSSSTVSNKSTLQDYYKFVEETTEKYPGYQAPTSSLPSPLAVKATTSTLSAMGLVSASHQVDLPYQVFCNKTSTTHTKKKKSTPVPDFPVALPLNQAGPSVPFSVVEAGQIYLNHLHNSKASQQLIQQREQAMHSSSSSTTYSSSSLDDIPILDLFEKFYKCIVHELQNVIVFFLKQLLTTIAPTSPCLDDTPEHVGSLRNNQVLCKSISAILLLLLKWTKLSHVLKFEYTSQLLVDSGCILLILKIIGLQDVISLASNDDTEMYQYSLFKSSMIPSLGEFTNKRNMFWMINLLRVLQKLTKNKPNRVMIMIQYKSTTLFKKLLKISHPMMELYTLKILKSQVPFQTRKWRANNMKIISAIYMKCTTSLYDDWMGKTETDDDLLDGKAEEINIRLLARIYHGQRYLPELLPVFDDAVSETWSSPSASSSATTYHRDDDDDDDHYNNSNNDDDDVFDTNELELDPSFVANYEIFLDDEVYHHEDDNNCLLTIEVDEPPLHEELEIEQDDETDLQDDFLSIDLEQDDDDDDECIELEEEEEENVANNDDDSDLLLQQDDDCDISDEICQGTPAPQSYDSDKYFDSKYNDAVADKNEIVDPTCAMMMTHHLQQHQTWSCPPSPMPSRSTC